MKNEAPAKAIISHGPKSREALRAAIKEKEKAALRIKCEAYAEKTYTKEKLDQWQKEYKGLWFLPIMDDDGNIERMLILQPVTRVILGYASQKMQSGDMYEFLEAAMQECKIAGEDDIFEDEGYFLSASNVFNKIVEGKKSDLLKR